MIPTKALLLFFFIQDKIQNSSRFVSFFMAQLPAQIRALIPGDSGQIEDMKVVNLPTPKPGKGEVLVRVFAAGVNRVDVLQRQGIYPLPSGTTPVLGLEAAGEICAVGEGVFRWKLGDQVMVLVAGGACAECVVVPEGQCLPVPANSTMIEAAALPEAVVTVWSNIFEIGRMKSGETALIHVGSGGVGIIALQMVKAFGGIGITTVSTDKKAEMCRKVGASLAINNTTHNYVKEIKAFTKDKGVDVVLDVLGGEYINWNLEIMAHHGRHMSIAAHRGLKNELDIRIMMKKFLTLTGSTLRVRSKAEKARLMREVEAHVMPLLNAGKIKPVIYQSFPMEKAAEAHKCMESGEHIGKIVLTV
jgi:NADPH2:quinone reductase